MADRGDTHYRVRNLNTWFAASSLVLLVSAVWMVLDDWARSWKHYQREFRHIEEERARAELASPEAQAAMTEEKELAAELKAAEERLGTHNDAVGAAEKELHDLKAEQFIVTEAEKKAKQEYNWERYLTDEHRIKSGEDERYQQLMERLAGFEERLAARTGKKQDVDAAVVAKQKELDRLRAKVNEIESEMKASTKSIELVRKKLESLDPQDWPTRIANVIRDFPGLDFIGPNLKVQKVLPPDLTFNLNFTRKRRVDMCQTCHMAVDREGFDDVEEPFRSHPRLDLFLTAKSPHPLSEVGCTICHRGSGESLSFQRVDHRPGDEEETERWKEEYDWHKQHYWDYPMLSSGYIEASCVQCHKDSLELIAPEAPKVAEGHRLFERYGCYACHKVEWFPTSRRPGPTLAKILQKTNADFVPAWITNPKSFRPTTWMPQIFHLENYDPDDEIVVSEYGQGRVMMGDEWSDAAIASVSAFVLSRSATEELPEIPVEGDAERGREVFRVSGCLACHNLAPFTAEARAEAVDPALRLRGTNEVGPNLRGVATKVSPRWLFEWIRDPKAYWPETRMPDLRLSEQDAADIVAYFFDDPDGYFNDVPEDWMVGAPSYARDVLEEQARWFFNRTLRSELDRRFREDWADDQELLKAVGERWVLNQGCHSCHEIKGLENAQPIGTELTNWGSKTVDKLDFGFIPEIFAEEHGWSYDETMEFKEYRENFLEQKLAEPRSFDRRKIKNPTERLRMPWFRLTGDQIRAIATFVVGLVDDEVQHAKMVPDADQAAMDHGLRVIRQKNCAGCHVIDPGTIEFADEDGVTHTVKGQILALEDEVLPPPLRDFQKYVEGYEDWQREETGDDEFRLEEAVVQLLRPEPGLGEVGTTIVVEDVGSIRTTPPWGGDIVDLVTGDYLYEDDVEDVDGERRSFLDETYEKVRWTYAPPVLINEGAKVQREWFYRFLLDPVSLRQSIRVRMPTFNWLEGEAGAVADYFAIRAKEDWPQRYARKLLLAKDESPEDAVSDMAELGLSTLAADQIQAIVDGEPVATEAGLPKLLAYGDALGFAMSGPVDPLHQAVPQRAPSTLDPLLAEHPGFFEDVHDLVVNGPNCVQCHYLEGQPPINDAPIGWAPDLRYVRERLRPDWVREFLTDPSKVYPGTTMPSNFPLDELQWQDLFPAPSREQIEAVLTWLFNLDRALIRD